MAAVEPQPRSQPEAVVGEAVVGEGEGDVVGPAVGLAVVGEAMVGKAVVGEAKGDAVDPAVGPLVVGEAMVGEAMVGEAVVEGRGRRSGPRSGPGGGG